MLNKIKMYIGYWLMMLSFYSYRKFFPLDWITLKKSFKVISHHDDYDSATVAANYLIYVCISAELHRKVEVFRRHGL